MNKIKYLIFKITHPLVRLYWKIFKPKTFGARAIIIHEDKILLCQNINSRHWSLPGGKIEKDESPEKCLLRELKEELDLDNLNIDFKLGEYLSSQEGKLDTVYIFVIKVQTENFKKQWELQDAKWFYLENLPENISPAGARRIEEYKNGKKEVLGNW